MTKTGVRPPVPASLRVAEPASAYDRRPRLVVDATVLAAALFGEAEQQQAAALLQARALCAPQLVDYEIANVAVKKLRRERLAESAVLACLDAYAALDLQRHAVEVGPVLVLAQRYQLTAYDAAYLWLAERRWRLLIRSSPRLRRSTWPGGLIRRCPEDDFS